MTQDQFDALAELLRLRGGAAKEAARMVLIDGLSPADAARATGISPQSVTNAVTRCRKGLALSKIVAGVEHKT